MYKKIKIDDDGLDYLRNENLRKFGSGDKIRTLIKLRCGNLEQDNKYWLEEDKKSYVFYAEGKDNMKHYVH